MIDKGTKKRFFKDLAVLDHVHLPFHAMKATWTVQCDAPPDMQTSTSVFHRLLHIPLQKLLPHPPPTELFPIQANQVEFQLIRKPKPLPIIFRPLSIIIYPLSPLLQVPFCKQWLLSTNPPIQTNAAEGPANCPGAHMREKFPLNICTIANLTQGDCTVSLLEVTTT